MKVLEEVAKNTAIKFADMSGDREAAFDPSIILVIMEIIMQLMGNFQNCGKSPGEAVKMMKNPRRIDLLAARLAIRRQVGGKEFRKNGEALLDAVFAQGKETTVEQVQAIYNEID